MFKRLQKLCTLNTSEPLQIARAASATGATVVCLDADGAKWMTAKGCKTITISDLEGETFDPRSVDPKTPLIFTTKALKEIADHGQYLRESLDLFRVQLAKEEDRHRKTKEDLNKRLDAAHDMSRAARHNEKLAQDRVEDLLKSNADLLRELSEARRPWWKKLFGKGGTPGKTKPNPYPANKVEFLD